MDHSWLLSISQEQIKGMMDNAVLILETHNQVIDKNMDNLKENEFLHETHTQHKFSKKGRYISILNYTT